MKNVWTKLSEKYLALTEKHEKLLELLEGAAVALQEIDYNNRLAMNIYKFITEEEI